MVNGAWARRCARWLLSAPPRLVKRVRIGSGVSRARARVRRQLGASDAARIRALSVCAFPNGLTPTANPFQGGYAVEKMLAVLGVVPVQFSPYRSCDIVLNWQDLTVDAVDTVAYVKQSYAYTRREMPVFVNARCRDIGKRTVGRLNQEVFGYPLDVDPTTYEGDAICKSDTNSTHDGRVVRCPLGPDRVEPGMVYSVLVDNRRGEHAVDFRVLFMDGVLEFFIENLRPAHDRFTRFKTGARLRATGEEFSPDEIARIEQICRRLGADFGEADVLRDVNTRRLYLVDFAKTPAGPPKALAPNDKLEVIHRMSVAFAQRVLLRAVDTATGARAGPAHGTAGSGGSTHGLSGG